MQKLIEKLKSEAISRVSGTVFRGVLWGLAAISAHLNIAEPDADTSRQVAGWILTAVLGGGATVWSWIKDGQFLRRPPK